MGRALTDRRAHWQIPAARYTGAMNSSATSVRGLTLLALAVLLAGFGGCRDVMPPAGGGREGTSASAAARAPGYLTPEERPDSVALVPPPAAPGSAEFA